MRRFGLVVVTCLLAGCGMSRAADKANDHQSWQGTWTLVSATSNGETETANAQWIVEGDHYNLCLDGKTHNDPYNFKLDPSQKRIDVFHHETPKGSWGGSYKGIYELKGDSLKVCYDGKGQRYPKTFEAGRGSGQILYQLKREGR